MTSKDFIFKISRSKLNKNTKYLLYQVFKNNIEECVDLLSTLHLLKDEDAVKYEISSILKSKCNIIAINDSEYPELLKQINTAPLIITLIGNKNYLKQSSVAVVGSREIEKTDILIISKIVDIINDAGFSVISGLAKGSDFIAHIKSLKYGTIAVLPCGLKHCYPKDHKFLIDKIIDFNGAVISELVFEQPPMQYNFIQRNRIIAGISESIVISRARDIKSGTISTANFALQFNKHIYTYSFNNKNEGNKYLIKNKIAQEIINLEELKYNLLIDKANNDINIENIVEQKYARDASIKQLFNTNIPSKILNKEIDTILKYSKYKIISEKTLKDILSLCYETLRIDKKDILKQLLIKIFYQKNLD